MIRRNYFRDFAFTGKTGAEYTPIWTYNGIGDNIPSFETLPDVFHFSFLGRSGSFVLQPGKQVAVFGTADSPLNYTVEVVLDRSSGGIFSIAITTDDNYVYTFGGHASAIESATSSDGMNTTDDLTLRGTWRLTSIEAPDGRTVEFSYSQRMITRTVTPTYTYDYSDYYSTYHDPEEGVDPPSVEEQFRNLLHIQNTPTTSEVNTCLLTSIRIPSRAEILFSYGAARCETSADAQSAKKLERIAVRSLQSNTTVRSAFLCYHLTGTASEASYPSTGSGITLLSSVFIPGEGCWTMHYDSETDSFPDMGTRAIDWMGFHNGNPNQVFCPALATAGNTLDNSWKLSMRQGSLAAARMGMLTSVVYPTGGRSDFEYELNDYSTDVAYERTIPNGADPGYGIRISRIVNRDADGHQAGSRSFSYIMEDGHSSGKLLWRPTLYSYYEMQSMYFNKITRKTLSTSDSFPYSRGVFIEYSRVLETVEGKSSSAGAAITERIYESYQANDCRDYTENWATGYSFPILGSWFFQLLGESPANRTARQEFNAYLQSRYGGMILRETEYSDDLYHPVQSTFNTYNYYTRNVACMRFADMQYGYLTDYCISLQDPWLSQTQVTDYSPAGAVIMTVTTDKTLDSSFRPATEQSTDSSGCVVTTSWEWLPACPSQLSQLLVVRSLPGGSSVISEGVKRTYATIQGHPGLYVPVLVETADPGGSPSTPSWRTECSCDCWTDKGLPRDIADKSGIHTAIVWGWGGMYPVMKVIGKTFNEVALADQSLSTGVLAGDISASQENTARSLLTAQVETMRWQPLVGMKSSSGASGKTTHYTYDTAGRLSGISNDSEDSLYTYIYGIYTINH